MGLKHNLGSLALDWIACLFEFTVLLNVQSFKLPYSIFFKFKIPCVHINGYRRWVMCISCNVYVFEFLRFKSWVLVAPCIVALLPTSASLFYTKHVKDGSSPHVIVIRFQGFMLQYGLHVFNLVICESDGS